MAWEATYLLSPVLLLLLASGCWAQEPEVIQTLEGSTVSLKCWYGPRYSFNEKIWCKDVSEDICQPLVWSASRGAEKLRFSIQEDSGFSLFTVTMTELEMTDSGIYHCGVFENHRRFISILGTIHLVVSKASDPSTTTRMTPPTITRMTPPTITRMTPPTTTGMTTAVASTHSPVIDSSPDKPMWKVIIAGVVVAALLVLGLVILVVLYLKKAREKAQNAGNKSHPIYEDFSGQKEETTSFSQQVLPNEDTETICYASVIHLNHVSPQDSVYRNTQPYPKPSCDPLLSVEYASISRNKSGAQEVETRD